MVEIDVIEIKNPNTNEIIIGQGNFSVKTIDDMYTAIISTVPNVKFGVAMNESKPQLTRMNGNDDSLKDLASQTALDIAAGHVFVIYLDGAYPINLLNTIKVIPCVVNIYVATSNPLELLVAKTGLGRAVVGVVDGLHATKKETDEEVQARRDLVKELGFLPA